MGKHTSFAWKELYWTKMSQMMNKFDINLKDSSTNNQNRLNYPYRLPKKICSWIDEKFKKDNTKTRIYVYKGSEHLFFKMYQI